ncbi:MAG: hypothetical protein M5U09_23690 [Gammaproteobacteria bacterium]|nr:hypothetical protein [Gammaproteobacteria bacterium]
MIAERGIRTDALIIHQDRGSPMIAHSFAGLMADLGVSRSYSRPRVSDDNAFIELLNRVCKYMSASRAAALRYSRWHGAG